MWQGEALRKHAGAAGVVHNWKEKELPQQKINVVTGEVSPEGTTDHTAGVNV